MNTLLKTLLSILTIAFALTAAPIMSPDSIPVSPFDPHLGQPVIATPNTVAYVYWEDYRDWDYNDWITTIQISPWTQDAVRITSTSMQGNGVFLSTVFMPQFAAVGSTLNVSLFVWNTFTTYHTGGGNLNPDGEKHAWVLQESTDVPEPVSTTLLGGGLLLIAGIRRFRK